MPSALVAVEMRFASDLLFVDRCGQYRGGRYRPRYTLDQRVRVVRRFGFNNSHHHPREAARPRPRWLRLPESVLAL
jgi:hypothetical protein